MENPLFVDLYPWEIMGFPLPFFFHSRSNHSLGGLLYPRYQPWGPLIWFDIADSGPLMIARESHREGPPRYISWFRTEPTRIYGGSIAIVRWG